MRAGRNEGKLRCMRKTAFAAIAIVTALSGCVEQTEAMQRADACRQAVTFGERFGTPQKRGPCWWRTTGHSVGFGFDVYTVEGPHSIASLTYQGSRMISATEVAKR